MGTQISVRITDTDRQPDITHLFLRRDYENTTHYTITVEPTTLPQNINMGPVTLARAVYVSVSAYSDSVNTDEVSIAKDGSIERVFISEKALLVGTQIESLDVVAPDGAILEVWIGGD